MNTDEKTTLTGNAIKVEIKQSNEQTNKNGWEKVIIGGVTGILMGAAGMYAANAFGTEFGENADSKPSGQTQSHETENGLKVAEVDDSLSFGEAFAAARNAVGAGGVFHWHGNIYNTFTESEWDNMTPQEHAQFAQQVQQEVRPEEMHSHHDTYRDTAQHHQDSQKETGHKDEDEPGKDELEKPDEDELEVHYLGVEQIETEDGQTINIGHMTIGDDEVAIVDYDNDSVFDVVVSDSNHNNVIEANEVVDISEAQLTVTDFAMAVAQENGGIDVLHSDVAVNKQENIAEDMTDYMNGADVQDV